MRYIDLLENNALIEELAEIKGIVMCKVVTNDEEYFQQYDRTFIESEIESGNYVMQD